MTDEEIEAAYDESYRSLKIVMISFFIFITFFSFLSSMSLKRIAVEKGATLACNENDNVHLISKRNGAQTLTSGISVIQENKKYNFFFCEIVDDDTFKKIRHTFF